MRQSCVMCSVFCAGCFVLARPASCAAPSLECHLAAHRVQGSPTTRPAPPSPPSCTSSGEASKDSWQMAGREPSATMHEPQCRGSPCLPKQLASPLPPAPAVRWWARACWRCRPSSPGLAGELAGHFPGAAFPQLCLERNRLPSHALCLTFDLWLHAAPIRPLQGGRQDGDILLGLGCHGLMSLPSGHQWAVLGPSPVAWHARRSLAARPDCTPCAPLALQARSAL